MILLRKRKPGTPQSATPQLVTQASTIDARHSRQVFLFPRIVKYLAAKLTHG